MRQPMNRAQASCRAKVMYSSKDFGNKLESFGEAFVGPKIEVSKADHRILPKFTQRELGIRRPCDYFRWPEGMEDHDKPMVFILILNDRREVFVLSEGFDYCRYVVAFDLT